LKRVPARNLILISAFCATFGVLLPHVCQAGILQALDTLMQNYAKSFYAEGSPGAIAEDWFKGKKEATLAAYAEAQQRVGEQALTDLKALVKELGTFSNYIPGDLAKHFATLKARFLARAANPWADDGGGAASATRTFASSIATPLASRTSGEVLDVDGMRQQFDDFVALRKDAQAAIISVRGRPSNERQIVEDGVKREAYQAEDLLLTKLTHNKRAFAAFVRWSDQQEHRVAKGALTRLVTRLVRSLSSRAVNSADRSVRQRAQTALELKNRIAAR
jgi:hypothetical protein